MRLSLVEAQHQSSLHWQGEKKGTVGMKYASSIVVSTVAVCLVGSAWSSPLTMSGLVGPAPTERAKASASSLLQVYSARVRAPIDVNQEEFLWNNDFGKNDFLYEPAHSDYTICTRNGKVLERVRNARNPNDPELTVVSLPPGDYEVKAKARNFGLVTIPVVIEAGKLTTVNLQRGENPVVESVAKANAVLLGGYRIVGWQAKTSAWPNSQ
jgi:hypothetical protein